MQKLLLKEFNLSINKFFLVLPIITGSLFLIPQWPYFIALMYFFFIAVPNIISGYNTQNDYSFTIMMPVSKADIVKSKILAFMILEVLHAAAGAVFAFLNTVIYHHGNFMLDPNAAFFGIAFIMFGLFNIVMFSMYFKTAFNYGLPLVVSVVITTVFVFGIEFLVIFNRTVAYYLEGHDPVCLGVQYGILIGGFLVFLILSWAAVRISVKRFEKVNL